MKKIFLSLSLLAAVVMGVHAEAGDGYRRTWDFTKGWSDATIAKLEADAADWEVQDATGFQNNPTAMTANETPWVMVDGEKDWVYGVLCHGRQVSNGDRISIDHPLTLMVGKGTIEDMDDVDMVDAEEMEEGGTDDFEEVTGN